MGEGRSRRKLVRKNEITLYPAHAVPDTYSGGERKEGDEMSVNGVSFDGRELIKELAQDIAECGRDKMVAVWLRRYPEFGNIEFAVNYDFIVDGKPIEPSEVAKDERLVLMQMGELMRILKKQNSVT